MFFCIFWTPKLEYKAPLRDIDFVLKDFLNSEAHYLGLSGCEEVSMDLADAIIREGAKFAENVVSPMAANADEQGCTFEMGKSLRQTVLKRRSSNGAREGGWP